MSERRTQRSGALARGQRAVERQRKRPLEQHRVAKGTQRQRRRHRARCRPCWSARPRPTRRTASERRRRQWRLRVRNTGSRIDGGTALRSASQRRASRLRFVGKFHVPAAQRHRRQRVLTQAHGVAIVAGTRQPSECACPCAEVLAHPGGVARPVIRRDHFLRHARPGRAHGAQPASTRCRPASRRAARLSHRTAPRCG